MRQVVLDTETTGLSWPEFLRTWAGELARLRARPAAVALLGSLPRGEFAIGAEAQAVWPKEAGPSPIAGWEGASRMMKVVSGSEARDASNGFDGS